LPPGFESPSREIFRIVLSLDTNVKHPVVLEWSEVADSAKGIIREIWLGGLDSNQDKHTARNNLIFRRGFLGRTGKRIADANFNKVWNGACVRNKIIQSSELGAGTADVVSHYEIREIQEDGKVRKQRTGSKAGSNDIKSPV
jgi:hypothetical protein